ncbi:MAG: uroporphyrinogen-III C-methyltransferase [Pseudomonadota bacterium]
MIANSHTGKLILIGCGPGAADLLTVRATKRIAEAELILYDRLIEPEVLEFASNDAERLYVGKAPGDGGVQQAALNEKIAEAVAAGLRVARLKSGDPMVFGRASEEIAAAIAAGGEVEIVPGVTAALAAAAGSAISVTERAELQSFVVTTGRAADKDAPPDWASLMKPGVCAAFYMGVGQAWRIQSTLMASGVPGHAPADWIERAGCYDSRTVSTTLERVAHAADAEHVRNPAVLLVRFPKSLAADKAAAAAQAR